MADHQFSDREALHIAVQIERKGERFYRMAQGVAGKGPAGPLLEMLRRQELAHAQRFESMLGQLEDGSQDEPYDLETSSLSLIHI